MDRLRQLGTAVVIEEVPGTVGGLNEIRREVSNETAGVIPAGVFLRRSREFLDEVFCYSSTWMITTDRERRFCSIPRR
jgi:hypothetical protein